MGEKKELDAFIERGFKVPAESETQPAPNVPMLHPTGGGDLEGKEFEPLREVVDGLITEGMTLLCGAPKVGKSWLMLQLCAAVASGTPFLGRKTTQGTVVYCAFEDSERRLQDRQRKQGNTPDNRVQFETKAISMQKGLLTALDGWMLANPDTRLIVIDTLQRIRGASNGRVNMYGDDYDVIVKLKAFADKYRVALVVVHHFNKMRDVDDPFERISGSTGLMGAADATIMVDRKRNEDCATLSCTGREISRAEIKIGFDDTSCRWQVADPVLVERERFEKSDVVRAILKFTSQGSFDNSWGSTFADFLEWTYRHNYNVGDNTGKVHKAIAGVADRMEDYYGLRIITDNVRIGKKRGFRIIQTRD